MSRREAGSPESGFTLLEMVIAIMVMSIAVVTLVGGLASMLQLSGGHRGYAATETGTHSFAQAVMAAGQFQTHLTATASATATTLAVQDGSLFAVGNYVSVDLETMKVTTVAPASLGVQRAVNPGATAGTHASGASVSRLLPCPSATDLTPPAGSYATTAGLATPVIARVEYWTPSGAFQNTSASSCMTDYNGSAICSTGEVLAECLPGLYRVTISLNSTDPRYNGVNATTSVLVRAGGT